MRGENREGGVRVNGRHIFVSCQSPHFLSLYSIAYHLAGKLNSEPFLLFERAAQPGTNAVTPSMGPGFRENGSTEGLAEAKADLV